MPAPRMLLPWRCAPRWGCAEPVLQAAAVVLDVDEDDHAHVRMVGEMGAAEAEERVAEFREFLDSVEPEDFSDRDGPGPT